MAIKPDFIILSQFEKKILLLSSVKAITILTEEFMPDTTKRVLLSIAVILVVTCLCVSLALLAGAISMLLGWL